MLISPVLNPSEIPSAQRGQYSSNHLHRVHSIHHNQPQSRCSNHRQRTAHRSPFIPISGHHRSVECVPEISENSARKKVIFRKVATSRGCHGSGKKLKITKITQNSFFITKLPQEQISWHLGWGKITCAGLRFFCAFGDRLEWGFFSTWIIYIYIYIYRVPETKPVVNLWIYISPDLVQFVPKLFF